MQFQTNYCTNLKELLENLAYPEQINIKKLHIVILNIYFKYRKIFYITLGLISCN